MRRRIPNSPPDSKTKNLSSANPRPAAKSHHFSIGQPSDGFDSVRSNPPGTQFQPLSRPILSLSTTSPHPFSLPRKCDFAKGTGDVIENKRQSTEHDIKRPVRTLLHSAQFVTMEQENHLCMSARQASGTSLQGQSWPQPLMSTPLSPKVPLLDVPRQTAAIRAELDAAIAKVLDHSRFILGPEVGLLEEQLAQYCGTRFAIACASGSDALLLPLLALNVMPGDTVLTTPFTFFASAGSIARAGATPAFIDIEPGTFNMDPAALAAYLESRSPAELGVLKAIMPVHLFGQCADMTAINAIASRFGIPVIEDAAQAIGARQSASRAGSMGLCGCLSFFPSKNLGGLGDGGMIVTDDADLAARLRLLRVHGSGATYYHDLTGINSRLDTLQAAVLLVKFRYLDAWTEKRRANAHLYRQEFQACAAPQIVLPVEREDMFHVFNQFTIRVPHRDQVRQRLAEMGIGSAVYYPLPLHLQTCFAHLGYREGDFPQSEKAAREVLSLPIEPGLSDDDIRAVVRSVLVACKPI